MQLSITCHLSVQPPFYGGWVRRPSTTPHSSTILSAHIFTCWVIHCRFLQAACILVVQSQPKFRPCNICLGFVDGCVLRSGRIGRLDNITADTLFFWAWHIQVCFPEHLRKRAVPFKYVGDRTESAFATNIAANTNIHISLCVEVSSYVEHARKKRRKYNCTLMYWQILRAHVSEMWLHRCTVVYFWDLGGSQEVSRCVHEKIYGQAHAYLRNSCVCTCACACVWMCRAHLYACVYALECMFLVRPHVSARLLS